MDLKIGILQELEAIKEGFNDAEKMDGYDLANERFHLENAIALVKKLNIPVVVGQSEQFSLSDIYKIAQNYTEEQFIEMVKHVQG